MHGDEDWDTSPEGLSSLISAGEGQHVEFKTRLPSDTSLARTLTAFANASGGILLIGVEDNGQIRGLTTDEGKIALHRIQAIRKSFGSLPIRTGVTYLDGKAIVYAAVSEIPQELRPLATAEGKYYVRSGAGETENAEALFSFFRGLSDEFRAKQVGVNRNLVAFVAMSFRNEEEPHLTDYYRAMERAAERAGGIDTLRMDLVDGDYEISQRLMDEINKADFVIADFTLNSRNVYFELGYARGQRKHIIQTARQGPALEFDIRNWHTLFYRNATELEEALLRAFEALKRSKNER